MKRFAYAIVVITLMIAFCHCQKEEGPSERFRLLTSPTWASDSLLVNGIDASGPGELLENFVGEVKFNEDGTGKFGNYTGTWRFAMGETELVIESESLNFPLTTEIAELTSASLKITTSFPNAANPDEDFRIRMTFRAK